MGYSEKEQAILDMMRKTDFKSLPKNGVFGIASVLSELKPDIATAIIAQFPEFASLLKSALSDIKDLLGNIIAGRNEVLKQEYSIDEKALDISEQSRSS